MHSNEYRKPEDSLDTYAHSWTSFDFSGGPVDGEVKITKPGDGLTMPLNSCAVFPSTLNIACRVTGDNTMGFRLQKPAKFAVVPNHLLALEKLAKMERKQTFEGYRNPSSYLRGRPRRTHLRRPRREPWSSSRREL